MRRSRLGLVAVAMLAAIPLAAPAQAPSPLESRMAAADSAWVAGQYAIARQRYAAVVQAHGAASPRALHRLATLLAWDNQLDEALGYYRRYLRLEPRDDDARVGMARTLAWAGRIEEAVAAFDSVIARNPRHRDAYLGAAQALAWDGNFRASIARYEAWLSVNPNDREARLALARTLSWAGRLRAAQVIYEQAERSGDTVEAQKGLARVAAWRGDLGRSIALWRRLSERHARDPEVWVGLAQALRWRSETEAAVSALDRALRIAPGHPEALAQRALVLGEMRPSFAPVVSWTDDSDDLRSAHVLIDGSFRPRPRVRLGAQLGHREAEAPGLEGRATDAVVTSRFWPGRGVTIGADAGASRSASDQDRSLTTMIARLRLALPVHPRVALFVSGAREPFTETAPLIHTGIVSTSGDLAADVSLPFRISLSAAGAITAFRGGSAGNTRRAATGSLRWTAHRALQLGGTVRSFGTDRTPGDGYFSPRQFTLIEGNVRASSWNELGWFGELDAGLGSQRVKFDAPAERRGAQRVSATIGYRPSHGSEVSLGWWYANVASASALGGGSGYHASGGALRARLPF